MFNIFAPATAFRSLASKLQSLSQDFRGMQKTYLDQLKKFKGGGSFSSLIGESSTREETTEEDTVGRWLSLGGLFRRDVAVNSLCTCLLGGQGFTTSQLMDLMSAEELATERDQEIRKICQSIEELSIVFKELAALVIDQGTIIDRIDYNMEQAVERTTAGLEQLKKVALRTFLATAACRCRCNTVLVWFVLQAEEHQKSSRPLKCMVLLVILIVIMVIILLVKKTG